MGLTLCVRPGGSGAVVRIEGEIENLGIKDDFKQRVQDMLEP
jgi:hypothetical protein